MGSLADFTKAVGQLSKMMRWQQFTLFGVEISEISGN
jgi:hypothetical protein